MQFIGHWWCICGLLVGGFAVAAEPVRWTFQTGSEFTFDLTTSTTVQVEAGPAGKVDNRQRHKLRLVWKVADVDSEGRARITQTVDRIESQIKLPLDQGFAFDSQSEEAPTGLGALVAPTIDAIRSEPIEFRLAPDGRIDAVTLSERLTTALHDAPGATVLGELASPEGLVRQLENLLVPLPSGELGDSSQSESTREYDGTTIGRLKVDRTIRYLGHADGEGQEGPPSAERFSIEQTVSLPASELAAPPSDDELAAVFQPQGLAIAEQSCDGKLLFDRAAGAVTRQSIAQHCVLKCEIAKQPTTTTVDWTVSFERVTTD